MNNLYQSKNTNTGLGSRRKLFVIPLIFIFLILLVISGLLIVRLSRLEPITTNDIPDIEALWDQGDYDGIISSISSELEVNPIDRDSLILYGYSYFYKGMSQVSQELRMEMLEESITSLRAALLFEDVEQVPMIEYILGKAYFQKGYYYSDLSIKFMERSLAGGYLAEDTYEYLGLAYTNLNLYSESIEYFLKASEGKSSPLWSLTIGRTYYNIKDNESAVLYLKDSVDQTDDMEIEQSGRMILADIYTETGDIDLAIEQYQRVIEINPENVDAHFYLGELYYGQSDIVQARKEWRATERLNPQHFGALTRLYD